MKIKTSEAKIRQSVNEELLKRALTKTLTESKFPTYTAWLGAEILKLEWKQNLKENNTAQQPSPEWIAETAAAFGLTEEEIEEATEIMNSQELNEIGGFLKAVVQPYKNMWQTFTNITQNAVNSTDPDKQQIAQTIDKVDDKLPKPAAVAQVAKDDPDELKALLRQILDILSRTDQATDLDQIQPGLEDKMDDMQSSIEQGAKQAVAGAGAEKEVFVFKGKGGKGLQSFLARGSKQAKKLQGPVMGAVLKHIAKQLKAQGMTVSEGTMDDAQGWIWYGLVENLMQEHYGAEVTISQILEALGDKKAQAASYRGKELKRRRQGLADKKAAAGQDVGNLGKKKQTAEDPTTAPTEIKPIKPTVKNTAPDDAPTVKVFRGKGGEGLQSALAMSRKKLGIDQQTVAVIIKSVEQWAQTNGIKVESVEDAEWNTIVTEITMKHRARELQKVVDKLKS